MNREQLPEDSRYVPVVLEDAPAPAAVAPISTSNSGPACVLVSTQQDLVEHCAAIAVGAAVRISQCEPDGLGAMDSKIPVLWGADAAVGLEPGMRCDVLVGTQEQSALLWKIASRLPQTRVAILPSASRWLAEYLGLWAMRAGHGHTLALGALAGGIGTSTLAFLLAHAGTLSGLRSVVMDLDPHSQHFWQRICPDPPAGVGWEELHLSGGALASHQLVETLPQVAGTSVLTWNAGGANRAVDEALSARFLAAARQGFDLIVVDTGRQQLEQAQVLGHLIDRRVALCEASASPPAGQYIVCGSYRRCIRGSSTERCLGSFGHHSRIEKAVARGNLAQCLKSRVLRQQLADLRLLPAQQAPDAGRAA